jgi:3-hydroxyisobutyrate dehydrogenase-like beta-hydroxyacid dehydrogenase
MGGPMASNLVKAGFPVTVWNRTASKAESLVKQGAKLAANPRAVALQADVLITIVSDPAALEEVLWGANGAIEGLRRGSLYIDSSTVSPDLARRVAKVCADRGVEFLDAPVTGGNWGAEKGELLYMIGGDAEVFDRAKPVLDVLGKKFFLLGPNGAGQTVKLGMNLILAMQVDALAEALAVVTAAGVEGERLVEVLQSSMGRTALLDIKAPLMLKHEYKASFPLRLMQKDLRLALEMAREHGVTLPAAAAAYGTYTTVKDSSNDDPDYAGIMRFWDAKAKRAS